MARCCGFLLFRSTTSKHAMFLAAIDTAGRFESLTISFAGMAVAAAIRSDSLRYDLPRGGQKSANPTDRGSVRKGSDAIGLATRLRRVPDLSSTARAAPVAETTSSRWNSCACRATLSCAARPKHFVAAKPRTRIRRR